MDALSAQSLSGMAVRDENANTLSAAVQHLSEVADAVPAMIWKADSRGNVEYFNLRWYTYTGQTERNALIAWADAVHPDDRTECLERWHNAVEAGHDFETEYRLRRYDGEYRWFLDRGVAVRDGNGDAFGWVGICTDIHEKKKAEDALRRSNHELQQFAYAASHDLQEPLRTITAFAQLAVQARGNHSDADISEYLQFVVDGAKRMQQLISDLLAYTRVTGAESADVETVDCNAIFDRVCQSVASRIAEKQAIVVKDTLPMVSGDSKRMEQLFQNLLSNALKYAKPGIPARIRISVASQNGYWLFAVADNGLGFPPERAEMIFDIFKRLHGADIPGTGVGLAICKTVVERLGGRIWAQSRVGEGSTFFFTLPAGPNQDC